MAAQYDPPEPSLGDRAYLQCLADVMYPARTRAHWQYPTFAGPTLDAGQMEEIRELYLAPGESLLELTEHRRPA